MSRILGIDWGTVRVGLALSDELGLTARPLATLSPKEVEQKIRELVAEHEVASLVVGLPKNLAGQETNSAAQARELGEKLSSLTGLSVTYVDERFSSKEALGQDSTFGVDAEAAALVLQSFLDGRQHENL